MSREEWTPLFALFFLTFHSFTGPNEQYQMYSGYCTHWSCRNRSVVYLPVSNWPRYDEYLITSTVSSLPQFSFRPLWSSPQVLAEDEFQGTLFLTHATKAIPLNTIRLYQSQLHYRNTSPGRMQSGLSREFFETWCTDPKNGGIIAGYCVAKTVLTESEEIITMSGEKACTEHVGR